MSKNLDRVCEAVKGAGLHPHSDWTDAYAAKILASADALRAEFAELERKAAENQRKAEAFTIRVRGKPFQCPDCACVVFTVFGNLQCVCNGCLREFAGQLKAKGGTNADDQG